MPLNLIEDYRDPEICRKISDRIFKRCRSPIRIMEVCGTHTMSIFRTGIRSILPDQITLLSGPGCPVCVTSQNDIDICIRLAETPGVIVATFGDMMRVPGTESSLERKRAEGNSIHVVYSVFDALDLAQRYPDKTVVFPGIGFETTAPAIAASILTAREQNLGNYAVFSMHKQVMPALEALMQDKEVSVDGFILPGHVSVIIGSEAYVPFVEKHRRPCVIAGFEPVDILDAVRMIVESREAGCAELTNGYCRAVTADGNNKAKSLLARVFESEDATWRGLGLISGSGYRIRREFESFDAQKRFDIRISDSDSPDVCECGTILTGKKIPPQCPLYETICTPESPVGPCMVSSEGTCAAYYRYRKR